MLNDDNLFVRQTVARPPLLRHFVGGFADFVAAADAATNLPWLASLARIEWLRIQAFHAPGAEALDARAWQPLLEKPWTLPNLGVVLHPACHWLHCGDGAGARWLAWHRGDRPDYAVDPSLPTGVLVSRPDERVELALVGAATVTLLDHLRRGLPLAAALHASRGEPALLLLDLVGKRLASALQTLPGEGPT